MPRPRNDRPSYRLHAASGLAFVMLDGRQVYLGQHGTPESIADQLEHWFTTGAADGFNILAPTLPHGLRDFAELVIPELQRRGLFRTEYTGRTLREHLGLRRPAHPSQTKALAAA